MCSLVGNDSNLILILEDSAETKGKKGSIIAHDLFVNGNADILRDIGVVAVFNIATLGIIPSSVAITNLTRNVIERIRVQVKPSKAFDHADNVIGITEGSHDQRESTVWVGLVGRNSNVFNRDLKITV